MKAVILAAGKGSRLQPLTLTTPKPLIEVRGKTILNHIIENLPDEVEEVLIVIKYLGEKIIDHIQQIQNTNTINKKVRMISQGEYPGTFGALFTLKDLFSKNERFLVLNGDDLHSKEELEVFLRYPLAIGVQKSVMPAYYSVELSEEGKLERFREQTDSEKESGALIATGAYLLDSEVFNFSPVKIFAGELGLPQTLIQNSSTYPLHAVETKNWHPINTQEDLDKINGRF